MRRIFLTLILCLISQIASAWDYRETTDQMRGTTTKFAEITSTNSVGFDFPYAGGSTLDLTLRKSHKDGFNIMFTISKGQMPCIMGCSFHAKFDDGKVERWRANGAANGDTETMFVQGASKFLLKLKKAKRVVIEADFYNAGSQQFQFDTQNLKWD